MVPNLPEVGLRNSKTIDIDSRDTRQQTRANYTTTNNSPRIDNSFHAKKSPRESKFKDYIKSLDVSSVDFSVDELNVPFS